MNDFEKTDFIITGNENHLGPLYGNYWTIQLRHKKKRTCVDVIIDMEGNPVSEANDITDLIRANFIINGKAAKIIRMSIDGNKMLVLKLPIA